MPTDAGRHADYPETPTMSLSLQLTPLGTVASFALGASAGEHFMSDLVRVGPSLHWLARVSEINHVPSSVAFAKVASGGELRTIIVRVNVVAASELEDKQSPFRRSHLRTYEYHYVEFRDEFTTQEAAALVAAGLDPESEQRRLMVTICLPEARLEQLLEVVRGGGLPQLEVHADELGQQVRLSDPDGRLREWDDMASKALDIHACRFVMPLRVQP